VQFLIADTFTDSLARLTGDEQKVVKTTAFDLQLNPASPGMSFHRLNKAKDPGFWSVRAGSDLLLIVHRAGDSLLLCYVDHHDKAYAWAERRKLETHPRTGAAQLVEIRELVVEIPVPAPGAGRARQTPTPRTLLAHVSATVCHRSGWPTSARRPRRTRCWRWRTTCRRRRLKRSWTWQPGARHALHGTLRWTWKPGWLRRQAPSHRSWSSNQVRHLHLPTPSTTQTPSAVSGW
jgi:hypothetical protein